ncbi:MAG: hypothetical protein ACP5GK_09050 [Desulfurella sp.]|uniref:hypothetical protein n=1 Tax=Desulfurella sp. TaxID=1962857 RepID=UPI003D145038
MFKKALKTLIVIVCFDVFLVNLAGASNLSFKTGIDYFHISFANQSQLNINSQNESGNFYGIYLKPTYVFFNSKLGRWFASTNFAIAIGNTDFHGASLKQPLAFHHANSYVKIEGHIGLKQHLNRIRFKEYFIGGWHEWNMYKKASYDEYLHSFYYGLGVGVNYKVSRDFLVGIDLSVRLAPGISSLNHMDENYPNIGLVKYDMGTGYNYKVDMSIKYSISRKMALEIKPYYNRWHYNASNSKMIQSSLTDESSYAYHTLGTTLGVEYKF